MTSHSTTTDQPQCQTETASYLFDNWFDPIEANLRDRAREFLQAMLEAELEVALGRSRYARRRMRASGDSEETANVTGHRLSVPTHSDQLFRLIPISCSD